MKNLIVALSLAMSTSLFAQELHFTRDTEKNCSQEVSKLGCGEPTEKNAETFIACVDQKVGELSEACQEYHEAVKSARTEHNH